MSRVMGYSLTSLRLALKPGLAKIGAMKKLLSAAALGIASLSTAPLSAHPSHGSPDVKPRVVVAVLAHPDDELVIAPALAGMARAGVDVRLIYATDGDQGPGVSDMKPGAALARARRDEAVCSMKALGAERMIPLELGDGTLGALARRKDSAANHLRESLGRHLEGATTVITWGPEGGYGHSDHRMVSAVVTQLLQAMPKAARPTLLYPALIHGPLPETLARQGWSLTAPDLATVNYRYDDTDLAASDTATQCHKTQFDEATRAALVPGFDAAVWKGAVSFRRAF